MRYPDLDIDLLRCFATAAQEGGFTAAGMVLGLTQSAISLKVKRLEDVLGRRVFERTGRRLSLTAEGEVLLVYARRLLSLNDEAVRRMIAPAVRVHLRLGVADHFVPQHWRRFWRGLRARIRMCSWKWRLAAAMSCVIPARRVCLIW